MMAREKGSESQRWECPHCGASVSRTALLCPACREPLTGPGAAAPVARAVERKAPAAAAAASAAPLKSPAPPKDEFEPRDSGAAIEEEESSAGARPAGALASLFAETLSEILEALFAPARTPEAKLRRVKVIAALLSVLIGGPWLIHTLATLPRAPRAAAPGAQAPVDLALAAQNVSAIEIARASLPEKTSVPETAPAAAPLEEDAMILRLGAGQVMRLSRYLARDSAPGAAPANPPSPEDVLPPLSAEQKAWKEGSAAERERFGRLLMEREEQAIVIGERLILARQQGISAETAERIARELLEDARKLSRAGGADTAAGTSAMPAAPGARADRTALETLLGPEDAARIQSIRQARADLLKQ